MLTKLIKSNFRNDLSHMISFVLIVVLSSFMLQFGLCIVMGYNNHYDTKAEELNSADVILYVYQYDDDVSNEENVANYIENDPSIETYEEQMFTICECEVIFNEDNFDSISSEDKETFNIRFGALDDYGEIGAPMFIERSDEEYANPIYLPYSALKGRFRNKYSIGDEIKMKINGKEYSFTLAGSYETLSGASPAYLSSYDFIQIKDDDNMNRFFDIQLKDGVNTEEYVQAMLADFNIKGLDAYYYSLPETIKASLYMINIVSAILCVFAVIITLVVVTVIYFRISNSIEQNIVNLGALKSLGYTGSQLRLAQILEFTITSSVGFAVSTVLLYISLPIFEERLLRRMTGTIWKPPFNLTAFLITGAFTVGATMIVSYLSTMRISTIDPVTAIRFGLKSHTFKKNSFPVEITSGPIVWILSLKSAFRNKKQNLLIIFIMAVVGITLSISIFFTYNIAYKTMNLYKLLSDTSSEASLLFEENTDAEDIRDIPGVDKAWTEMSIVATIKGTLTEITVSDDWAYVNNMNLTEGRVPVLSNEIVIGNTLADNCDIKVGDEIEVACSGYEGTYVVTGLCQTTYNFGVVARMTADGLEALNIEYSPHWVEMTFSVTDYESSKNVLENIQEIYGDKLYYYSNAYDYIKNGDDVDLMVAKALCFVFIIVSIVIIFLSMVLLVKTIIIKSQKEIGIKKSLGFTSSQLRMELTLSLMPNIVIGLAIGSLIGFMNANRFLSLILKNLGIYRSTLEELPWMPLASVVSGTVVTFILVWFLSHRIKKISAYKLIRE
ncbi:MAG: ABC transporter permease [Clostridia bacterium]|nr:ABC transporter permease [Clostridia bacterium]